MHRIAGPKLHWWLRPWQNGKLMLNGQIHKTSVDWGTSACKNEAKNFSTSFAYPFFVQSKFPFPPFFFLPCAQGETKKLWGGRFRGGTDPIMERFNNSFDFDKRMWAADLEGSRAYAKALEKAGIITAEERDELVRGLDLVKVRLGTCLIAGWLGCIKKNKKEWRIIWDYILWRCWGQT